MQMYIYICTHIHTYIYYYYYYYYYYYLLKQYTIIILNSLCLIPAIVPENFGAENPNNLKAESLVFQFTIQKRKD
jgi:hypothetical protein